MSAAQRWLDQVHSLARVDAAAGEPGAYAELVAAELGVGETLAELDARDARLRDALAKLDAMIERAFRVRMDHALAADVAIGAPTRKVFAATVIGYADRLELLAARARDAAARGGARDPDASAEIVVAAARAALTLRDAIRDGVLALVRMLATAAVGAADRTARDRTLDDAARHTWSALRRELEALATSPARIADAPFAARLASWPAQLDDPPPEREVTFADMIELD